MRWFFNKHNRKQRMQRMEVCCTKKHLSFLYIAKSTKPLFSIQSQHFCMVRLKTWLAYYTIQQPLCVVDFHTQYCVLWDHPLQVDSEVCCHSPKVLIIIMYQLLLGNWQLETIARQAIIGNYTVVTCNSMWRAVPTLMLDIKHFTSW